MLEPHHLAHLRTSGLSDETIAEAGIFSEIDVASLINCREELASQLGQCIVFPFIGLDGSNGYYRIRPDKPRKDSRGKIVKYESPHGQPNRIYFPPKVRETINTKTLKGVLITEGEKKALKATQEGADCIGLVGVNGWQRDGKMLPELDAIEWRGVHVWICYDSDAATNPRVASAEQGLAKALMAKGAIVHLARIPSPDGQKYGLDDYIVKFGVEAFQDVLQSAEIVPDSRPVKTLTDFMRDHPNLKPVVIDGLLRRGETCNIIAAPKIGKSYMALGLAWCVATGLPWLGRTVTQGRVLILDNELEPGLITNRMVAVAKAMGIDPAAYANQFVIESMRGEMADIDTILERCSRFQPGEFTLTILDALYRTLPEGKSENDNAHMMLVYSRLDAMAARLDSALTVVHHTSKGDQAGKGVTDVGSGAGSISRAADTHITIRPHEREEYAVMEAVTRSFASPEPKSISWTYPLWSQSVVEPVVRTAAMLKGKQKEDTDSAVYEAIDKPMIHSQIRAATGFQYARVTDSLLRLKEAGRICIKQDGKRVLYERSVS